MEYLFSIIVLGVGIWGISFFALDAYNKNRQMRGLFKVSKKFPDEDEIGLTGKIVRVESLHKDEAYVKAIEPIIKREKVYNNNLSGYYASYTATQLQALQQAQQSYNWVTREDFPEGYIHVKYLKRVKELGSKGGEKKVKNMPRLWKWLIIYLPATILVWDVVTHANQIALWVVGAFPHR